MAVPFSQMGVFTPPGSIRTTSTPMWPTSRRSESLMPSSANFDAAYGPASGSAMRPPMELTFTIRGRAPGAAAGRKAWVTATWPMTLISS